MAVLREPSTHGMPPEANADDGGVLPLLCQVDTPEPESESPPALPPKGGGDDHSAHEVTQAVAGGTTDEFSSRQPSDSGGAFPPRFFSVDLNRSLDSERSV
jgi:hypothetical protein